MGSARVGLLNISYPFAKLRVSRELVKLSTLLGIYELSAFQVIELYPIRFLGIHGIRILHRKSTYPAFLTFFYFGSREKFFQELEATEFQSRGIGLPVQIRKQEQPLRPSFLLLSFSGFWLLLLTGGIPLFLVSIIAWSSSLHSIVPIQKFGLKRRRHIDEVRHWLRLVFYVSLAMLIALL